MLLSSIITYFSRIVGSALLTAKSVLADDENTEKIIRTKQREFLPYQTSGNLIYIPV